MGRYLHGTLSHHGFRTVTSRSKLYLALDVGNGTWLLSWANLTANVVPDTEAVTLEGANVRLPALFRMDSSVVVAGFSQRSSGATREWSKRLFEAEKSKGRSDVYGLLMLARVPRLARRFVTDAVRRDISPAVVFAHATGHPRPLPCSEWCHLRHIESRDLDGSVQAGKSHPGDTRDVPCRGSRPSGAGYADGLDVRLDRSGHPGPGRKQITHRALTVSFMLPHRAFTPKYNKKQSLKGTR